MDPRLPLAGLSKERNRLISAFAKREPLLLLGPAGSGKTRLLQEAACAYPEVLYVPWEPTLHALLAAIARALIAARHAGFLHRAKPGRDAQAWLASQTSIHLKGLLWSAIEGAPVPMALDGITGAGFPTYRFLQRIYHTRGMALFAASRDSVSLGALGRLYWHPANVMDVQPLNERDSAKLFDAAADYFHLWEVDLEDFRKKVLDSARGIPGQIIEMCRLATQPQYISGRHVKFTPLRIDTVIKFAGSHREYPAPAKLPPPSRNRAPR